MERQFEFTPSEYLRATLYQLIQRDQMVAAFPGLEAYEVLDWVDAGQRMIRQQEKLEAQTVLWASTEGN